MQFTLKQTLGLGILDCIKKMVGCKNSRGHYSWSFVFEFIGDIITNSKMANYNYSYGDYNKHIYNMVSDVNEIMENMLNDGQVLCLDGTKYGNVGRFLNHKCIVQTWWILLYKLRQLINTCTM